MGLRSLYYLCERELRTHLSQLYVAITSTTNNAELIAKHNISDISSSDWTGNDLARICALDMHDWLLTLKYFCASQGVFNDQVLEPVRIVAKYILDINTLKSHTTDITGWIFRISQPYNDNSDTRITLSLVVPDLATIISIRIHEDDLKNISHGFYKFGNVKPIPLVNRMKQSRNIFSKVSNISNFSTWDFLKIGFNDHINLETSLEMESFCEIASSNNQQKRCLGTVFIMVGKILSIRWPSITIQSVVDEHSITMSLSDDCVPNNDLDSLENYKEKYVRIMAIQWYNPPTKTSTNMPSELIRIEIAARDDVIIDDLIGYIRIRQQVSYNTLNNRYKKILSGDKITIILNKIANMPMTRIFIDGSNVNYIENCVSTDPIISKFLCSTNQIHALRHNLKFDTHIQANQENIIDYDKLSTRGIVKYLKYTNHSLKELLCAVQLY